LVFVLLIACCACAGPVKELYPPSKDEPTRSIYLVSHGWHTGIVIKRMDIPNGIWPDLTL
jgi:hypothetical protein